MVVKHRKGSGQRQAERIGRSVGLGAEGSARAREDLRLGRELHVHLNLMPFNPIDQAAWLRPSPPARERRFSAALKAAGFTVTTRFSLGKEIAAACGQLIQS